MASSSLKRENVQGSKFFMKIVGERKRPLIIDPGWGSPRFMARVGQNLGTSRSELFFSLTSVWGFVASKKVKKEEEKRGKVLSY